MIETFEDLRSWQEARRLTQAVYGLSDRPAFRRERALRDQIRRAAVSVMANISEGFERKATREFIAFLGIARASAGEVRSHLYVALDSGLIDRDGFDAAAGHSRGCIALVDGMVRYLKTVEHRGQRYKPEKGTSNINP